VSATTEGLREDAFELGRVGAREGGCCCRIRRRPESPKPCSWSVIGDGLIGARGQQTKASYHGTGLVRNTPPPRDEPGDWVVVHDAGRRGFKGHSVSTAVGLVS
jgi:hypothetical protein